MIAYFIMSHTNVPQVARLVRTLLSGSPKAVVLIHHDDRIEPFDRLMFADEPRVHFTTRTIHAQWATFALVDIVFEGIATLEARAIAYDWLVLLSGQDYPIRPLPAFERALKRSGDGLLSFDPEPGALLDRYRFRWFRLPRRLEHGIVHRMLGVLTRVNRRQPFVRVLSGRVGCRIALAPRRSPLLPDMRFYKGAQWWALSARAVRYVRSFAAKHPSIVAHFRNHTIMPDESFFQTILYNAAPALTFVNDDGRFTKWASASAASPQLLGSANYDEAVASGTYFARKIDTRIDATFVERFDRVADPERKSQYP